MKSISKFEFKANLVLERSITPVVEDLGEHDCSMELLMDEDSNSGIIEWVYEDSRGVEDATCIGVWFKGKTLTDYDGLMSLPKQAVQLLRKAGYTVPKDFEN